MYKSMFCREKYRNWKLSEVLLADDEMVSYQLADSTVSILGAVSPIKWREKVQEEYVASHYKERDDLIFFVKSDGKEVRWSPLEE